MSEWLKEHAWKACVGETLPWVRIPLSPPLQRRQLPQTSRRATKPARVGLEVSADIVPSCLHADHGAFRRLDAQTLAFQVQALARESELGRGFLHPAAALFQRVLQHRAFEVLGRGGQRLVESNYHLGRVESAFRGRNGAP